MANTLLYNTEIISLLKIPIGKTAINLKNGMLITPISYQLERLSIRLVTITKKVSVYWN